MLVEHRFLLVVVMHEDWLVDVEPCWHRAVVNDVDARGLRVTKI